MTRGGREGKQEQQHNSEPAQPHHAKRPEEKLVPLPRVGGTSSSCCIFKTIGKYRKTASPHRFVVCSVPSSSVMFKVRCLEHMVKALDKEEDKILLFVRKG